MNNDMRLTRRKLLGFAAALGASAFTLRLLCKDSADSFDWTVLPPDSAGLSPSVATDLRAVVQQYIDGNKITGAVTAIARNNRLVFFEAQGTSNPETGEAMRKDDLFRVMSATKVVTAVSILILLDEGKVSLDDKVSRFIPGFAQLKVAASPNGGASGSTTVAAQREITIKDLLTHTSGLSSGGFPDPKMVAELSKKISFQPDDTLATFIPRLANATLDFQPGSRFSYSPIAGFDVLAYIVEVVTGQSADAFMRERIFEPLDMRDTWFHVPPDEQARIVPHYVREGDRWRLDKGLLDASPPRYICGAGGLYSTAHDFLSFYLMLLNNGSLNGRRVLKPETVVLMSQNHVGSLFAEWVPPLTAGMGFGLGVRVVLDGQKIPHRGVGAFGWGGAYGTEPWADPQLGVAGVVMTQQPDMTLPIALQATVRRAISA